MTIPWAYPLAENKTSNDHNLLISVIEDYVRDIKSIEKKLDRAIKCLQKYERDYYESD